jgi:hypothetical protein
LGIERFYGGYAVCAQIDAPKREQAVLVIPLAAEMRCVRSGS